MKIIKHVLGRIGKISEPILLGIANWHQGVELSSRTMILFLQLVHTVSKVEKNFSIHKFWIYEITNQQTYEKVHFKCRVLMFWKIRENNWHRITRCWENFWERKNWVQIAFSPISFAFQLLGMISLNLFKNTNQGLFQVFPSFEKNCNTNAYSWTNSQVSYWIKRNRNEPVIDILKQFACEQVETIIATPVISSREDFFGSIRVGNFCRRLGSNFFFFFSKIRSHDCNLGKQFFYACICINQVLHLQCKF